MEKKQSFSYWKQPWGKWAVLAAAIAEIWIFWDDLTEYQTVLSLNIYSASAWNQYAVHQKSECMLDALIAAALIGIFLIGALARSKKSARLAESLLVLSMAAAIGIWMLVCYPQLSLSLTAVFLVILAITLVGGFYLLSQYRKTAKEP